MTGPIRKLSMIGAIAVVATGCGSSDTPSAATIPSTMPPMTTTVTTTTTVLRPDPNSCRTASPTCSSVRSPAMCCSAGCGRTPVPTSRSCRSNCEALGTETLSGMSAQWQDIQQYIAAANADSSTTTPTPFSSSTKLQSRFAVRPAARRARDRQDNHGDISDFHATFPAVMSCSSSAEVPSWRWSAAASNDGSTAGDTADTAGTTGANVTRTPSPPRPPRPPPVRRLEARALPP